MLLVPDPKTHFMDPFRDTPTLVMIGDVVDPITKQAYPRDPRHIARKAEAYLGFSGVADQAFFGAEAEFFIFDNIRFDQAVQHGFYFIDSEEGRWNSGREQHNLDRKSTRLNSSHSQISYAVFCLKKKKKERKMNY